MDLKETDILGLAIKNHWYYSSKAKALSHFLGKDVPERILDVGAGSGFFSRYLLTETAVKEAWCVDTSYAADSEEIEAGKAIHFRRSVEQVDAKLVLLMDVLEHVDDDVSLLKEYIRKVPSGSRFLITVPAFKFLWSGHDNFLDHKRRYTLNGVEELVRKAGLKVKLTTYYFGAVFPIAALLRLTKKIAFSGNKPQSQLSKHSFIVNSILKSACALETPLMNMNRIAGLTVFCLAESE